MLGIDPSFSFAVWSTYRGGEKGDCRESEGHVEAIWTTVGN